MRISRDPLDLSYDHRVINGADAARFLAHYAQCPAEPRRMLERDGGGIIFVASVLSFQGGFNVPGYAAAKGGIAQLTRAFANEWASQGATSMRSHRAMWRPTAQPRYSRTRPVRGVVGTGACWTLGRAGRHRMADGLSCVRRRALCSWHRPAGDGGWLAR
ncbi:SDR family NAD(P)-dependent oxidoreductase [uncultured Nitratireductor sp.]|uniref:SDR family NAD(P)-dependent oxidoreductase n=1 Tax=uncultured Nitratireductor sp. TaxID=520953 RepID=UPI0025F8E680|nr:SDR family NAD(P)-dependent oxidoreductase [uncultured Nitratireductor sp.]